MFNAKFNKKVINLTYTKMSRQDYKQLINKMVSNSEDKPVQLEMSLLGIYSMDTDDLAALIFLKKYAAKRGVKLLFTSVSGTLKQFFELTRTDNFFALSVI